MTTDARTRLRRLGQSDLGLYIEAATGTELWSIQRQIASEISKRRAHVAVPSCNASGKTYLGARLALAFYDAYTPGTPCDLCHGPCGGAKIITTSSKHDHLRHVLWGEIRAAYSQLEDRGLEMPGKMFQGQNLLIDGGSNHFIIGHSANQQEGFQGYHAPHKLILGDEATALDDEVSYGVTGLLASGDSRLLLIFNPTTPDTWAARESQAPATKTIKITAWDTPHFTDEPVPPRSNLITPEFLAELQDKGMGPGTYEWTTRVEADFWNLGDDVLIPAPNFDRAMGAEFIEGTRALGIDLAPYGTDENVIAVRNGNALTRLEAYPSMRQELFWEGPVADMVRATNPDYLIWDADGVGAGVYGYAENVAKQHNARGGNLILLPFRGGIKVVDKFLNARSAWWWGFRRKFEAGTIALPLPPDPKLRAQVTDIRYSITDNGDIKVETKATMRKRGLESPDRGDAAMYAFSMVDELPVPSKVVEEPMTAWAGVKDRSDRAMWRRDLQQLKRRGQVQSKSPWDKVPVGYDAWDDL